MVPQCAALSAPIKAADGKAGFDALLGNCDIHVCVLPLTPSTTDLFDASAFAQMKQGAYFINGGRGKQVVEPDLLDRYPFRPSGWCVFGCVCRRTVTAAASFFGKNRLLQSGRMSLHKPIRIPLAAQVAAAIRAAATGDQPLSNLRVDTERGRGAFR